jgi:hypothetical protein
VTAKHNAKHPDRGLSHYPDRLRARGLGKAPQMAPVDGLRNRQERRIRETCSVDHRHDIAHCDGRPWRVFTSGDDEL